MSEEFDWKQDHVIHCPDRDCKGMLLNSDYVHYHKCSDCGKEWMSITKWVEYTE